MGKRGTVAALGRAFLFLSRGIPNSWTTLFLLLRELSYITVAREQGERKRGMRWAIMLMVALTTVPPMSAEAADMDAAPLVGHLVDFSGRTATVGQPYGQAKIDAARWINDHGGINGKRLNLSTFDYAYEVPRALAQYGKWHEEGAIAIQGWGTADTEALVGYVAEDKVPYFSASYAAELTDPTGEGPETRKPTPYNFIMGPSYSDSVRALLQWAKDDWNKKGTDRKPSYVHMGDQHPYPNAPKRAGESHASDLGFEVQPALQYTLAPTDFAVQCLTLKERGTDYVFLANTTASNIALIRTCTEMGVKTQYLVNIWGFDEEAMKALGPAANGVVWVMGSADWRADVPGMKRVKEIAAAADPAVLYRSSHYIRGICAMFFMKEAMEWADRNGGMTGERIKQGMYQRADWIPEGLAGVCSKATWSPQDHRGFTRVMLYQADVRGQPEADADLGQLMEDGVLGMRKIYEIDIPRKPEWLGW